jgi:hypothetical protein
MYVVLGYMFLKADSLFSVCLENTCTQQHPKLVPIHPVFGNLSVLKLKNHNGVPRNVSSLDVVVPHSGPQGSASYCPVCDSHDYSISRLEDVVHFGVHAGIGGLYPFHHSVNPGKSLNVARSEMKFTIGLKHAIDKLDLSAVEHIMKVAEDELLLGRRFGWRCALSIRANWETDKRES